MEYVRDAVGGARIAGDFLREVFKSGSIKMEYKGKKEIVTSADKGAEQLIIEYLSEHYPQHRIVSEESGAMGEENSRYVWYVDPLDGTSNFFHHIPFFNVSIALQHEDKLLCGAVYNPMLNEMFYAEKGGGAYLNGERIAPCEAGEIEHAFITACHGRNEDEIAMFLKLMQKFKYIAGDMRKLGSAALELCYVACGRADAFIGYGIRPWDFKAGLIIGMESRCRIGGIMKREAEESNLLMCAPAIYNDVRKIIDEVVQ